MITTREVATQLRARYGQIIGTWETESPKALWPLPERYINGLANARVNLELVIPEEPDTINLTGYVRATSGDGCWVRLEVVFTDLFTMVDKNKSAFFKDRS